MCVYATVVTRRWLGRRARPRAVRGIAHTNTRFVCGGYLLGRPPVDSYRSLLLFLVYSTVHFCRGAHLLVRAGWGGEEEHRPRRMGRGGGASPARATLAHRDARGRAGRPAAPLRRPPPRAAEPARRRAILLPLRPPAPQSVAAGLATRHPTAPPLSVAGSSAPVPSPPAAAGTPQGSSTVVRADPA